MYLVFNKLLYAFQHLGNRQLFGALLMRLPQPETATGKKCILSLFFFLSMLSSVLISVILLLLVPAFHTSYPSFRNLYICKEEQIKLLIQLFFLNTWNINVCAQKTWVGLPSQVGQSSEGKCVCCCSIVSPLKGSTSRPERNPSLSLVAGCP